VARICYDFHYIPRGNPLLGCIRDCMYHGMLQHQCVCCPRPRIHRIFFCSLRIKRGTPLLERERGGRGEEGESHCFVFLSRARRGVTGSANIFRVIPLYISLSGCLLLTRAISLAKSSKCVYYFSPLLPRPFPPPRIVSPAFLFNRSGSKYGEAEMIHRTRYSALSHE